MFEGKGEGSEARVIRYEAVDHGFEEGAREEEGCCAAGNGCCRGYEPTGLMSDCML